MLQTKYNKPKKVLLLDSGKEWGGGTVSMIDLVKRFNLAAVKIHCCFYYDYTRGSSGEALSDTFKKLNIPFDVLPNVNQTLAVKSLKEIVRILFFWHKSIKNSLLKKIDFQWRIKKRIQQILNFAALNSIDLIYLNNQPSSNLEGYLAAKILKLPVVQHCRIDVALSKYEIEILNGLAQAIICNSSGLRNSLTMQGVNPKKIEVIYTGFELTEIPEKVSVKFVKQKIILGTVSSLVKRKSIEQIIKGFALARQKYGLDGHLIIVGEGPERKNLESLMVKLHLRECMTFVGFSAQPLAWMQVMDVFLFASNREGLTRVLIEAMLCKKPLVAARTVGPSEIILHQETGYLYDYGDVSSLASYINALARDKKMRLRMGELGFVRAKNIFNMSAYISGVEKILLESLK